MKHTSTGRRVQPPWIILYGPSGSGKSTLATRVIAAYPSVRLSRSWTTRQRRQGEPDEAYEFVSREAFERGLDEGTFLEWTEYLGNLYGTPWPDADNKVALFDVEINGVRALAEVNPICKRVLVAPPSLEELGRRLFDRGDNPSSVGQRIANAEKELALGREIADLILVNRDLDATWSELANKLELLVPAILDN